MKKEKEKIKEKDWYSCQFGCNHYVTDKCSCECHNEFNKQLKEITKRLTKEG